MKEMFSRVARGNFTPQALTDPDVTVSRILCAVAYKMREIRQSGSEGGALQTNAAFLPLQSWFYSKISSPWMPAFAGMTNYDTVSQKESGIPEFPDAHSLNSSLGGPLITAGVV